MRVPPGPVAVLLRRAVLLPRTAPATPRVARAWTFASLTGEKWHL